MAMTMSQKRSTFSVFRYFVLTIWLLIVAFPAPGGPTIATV